MRRRFLAKPAVVGVTAALCAVVFALSTARAAYACTNIPGNNWGVAEWFNTANDQGGGSVDTTVSATGISGASSGNHINQTLWVGTDGATDLQYWVELGYDKGLVDCSTDLNFYWADNRPNGGSYHQHLITQFTPAVGTTYGLMIDYVGSSTWNVVINETRVAQSTSNPGDSYSMETGAETTTTANYLPNGDSDNMSNRVNGNWTNQWGSGTTLASTDPPCTHASWVTKYVHLSDGIYGC
jgi:hypothetical protein